MIMLVDCSNCHTALRLPINATSIRCALCQAVTLVATPRDHPPPSLPSGNHTFSPSPPLPHHQPGHGGRKKAVICGVSYKNTKHELKGCINDAKCMKYMLVHRFKFPEAHVIMLTEEETDPLRHPTKHNIRMALYWLVNGCQSGDSLLFHYSGHGSQQRNYTGDEIDGFDETLCPMDFETQGMIVDDEINATIVKPLPHGVKLHAIIDACHSGTVLDLPFLCRMDRSGRYVWEDHRPRSGTWKGTSGGEVISFSGCDDDQTSADTSALSKVTSTGAMTYSFIQAIEREQAATYGSMLASMRSTIRNTENDLGGGVITSLLGMLLNGGSLSGGMRQVIGWRLLEEGVLKLQCLWKLRDFKCGVELINRTYNVVGVTNQFPNLHLEHPNQVRAVLWTSTIGGLNMNDFIVAAKIDEIKTSDLVPKKRVWA